MNDDVQSLLESYDKVNSITISLTRCLILALLSYFLDGIQYRELKTALKISDGKLISNLNKLREMQYVEKLEIDIDRNKIDMYVLNKEGKVELNKILKWMESVKKVAKQEEEKVCQLTLTK